MRPQHITAENERSHGAGARIIPASMRPQHITAENIPDPAPECKAIASFNEAAAYHCGKPHLGGGGGGGDHERASASMRPQHITAENAVAALQRGSVGRRGFNEAAAYHCGKRCECRLCVAERAMLQ